jgi:hypothetical protein
MKRILAVVLTLILSLSVVSTSFATSNSSDPNDTITKLISSINSKDWNTYISLQSLENKDVFQNFINNPDNKKNQIGLFDIKSATLKEIKQVGLDSISSFSNIIAYQDQYSELSAFLVGIDYKVANESKYYFNGVNYSLIILGKESGTWHIAEMSDAPLESLVPMGLGFGSDDEKSALNVVKSRLNGIIVNKSGKIIEKNQATSSDINQEKGLSSSTQQSMVRVTTSSDHTRPTNIRVYRVSLSRVDTVEFYSYCKNVLPNEWVSSWASESLKAGAEVVKMYGWYHVYHPKWSSLGADVKDTTADQVYIPSTEVTSTTNAINAVSGVGLQNTAGDVFESQYVAGTSGSPGTQNSGTMTQYGTKYWAAQGEDYLYMCSYYYDNSNKSTGAISTFSY